MKPILLLIAIVFGCPLAFAESAAEKAEVYYQKGLAAEKVGNPDAAKAAYRSALEAHPGHANARYRFGQVKIHATAIKSSGIEAKIGEIMIPVYQLEDATMQEAIELLSMAIDKQTEGKMATNFVIEDPKSKLVDKRITMDIKNIPVKAILSYLHAQTSTRARYDEHAVVILAR